MHMSGLFYDESWSPDGALQTDFSELTGITCYCDQDAEHKLEDSIRTLPLKAIHWIDTGDFHYLSALWLRRLERPARLFLFDNHPDDQEPAFGGGLLSCGSWVAEVRKNNPMVRDDAEDAYISIDLDCLSTEFARTDWDQGNMHLQELLSSLDRIRGQYGLAGVDICGGITRAQGGSDGDFAVNRRTRQVLLDYFSPLD